MTEPVPPMDDDRALPWPARYDLPALVALGAVVLGFLLPTLGVWEPWEADHAGVARLMRETGAWLSVEVPEVAGRVRAVPELPFGWWPVAVTTGLFGVNELGLRLPGVLAGLGVLWLVIALTRRTFGRLAGLLAGLSLLSLPLFVFHTRLALGAGLGTAFIALGALAFLRRATDPEAGAAWAWGAWLATAAAGLTAGATGLLAPLLAGAAAAVAPRRAPAAPVEPPPEPPAEHGDDDTPPTPPKAPRDAIFDRLRRLAPPAPMAVGLALVAIGWWRALAHLPEGAAWTELLLWADPLSKVPAASARPSFDLFVHQIGFGLFPLAALLPFAFADLLWAPPRDDEPAAAAAIAPGLAAWFAVAFLGPALGAPEGQFALFLGAPAVAVAVGVYLARVVRTPPQPLLALGAVLVLALLDSNLKHETHYLADTLVGEAVDAFPDTLPGWALELKFRLGGMKVDTTVVLARLFSFGLLGLLIVYQGRLHRWFEPAVRALFYPTRRRRLFDPWTAVIALAAPALVFGRFGEQVERLLFSPAINRLGLKVGVRKLLLFAVVWAIAHFALRALWNLRVARLKGAQSGLLTRLSAGFAAFLDRPRVTRLGFVGLLLGWALFLNVVVAHALTTNFSQRQVISRYHDLADAEEPLFTYRLDARNSSFYASELPSLQRGEFVDRAKKDERFFAIIPRPQLSSINTEFRKATGRTLPVLDDSGHRFRLVSNTLEEGEEDLNPIEKALIPRLPADATPIDIVFDDKIALVGYKLEPDRPRAGSPLTISLFWKALKPNVGQWKVFVHIDAPGQRIHGDHDPFEGLFPTSDWSEGDLVRDDHQVVVKRTISPNRFTFYAGLYRGNTRMPISKGAKDRENRARLGYVRVR